MKNKPLYPAHPIFKGVKTLYDEQIHKTWNVFKITICPPTSKFKKEGEQIELRYTK